MRRVNSDLMAAWEGRDVEQPTLQAALAELVVEMRESRRAQETATLALLRAVTALTRERDAEPVSVPTTSRRNREGTG